MKKPELLAPAGNMESLIAAIQAGCDAVYISGKKYGARAYATNFTEEEIRKAIKYAHLYDVKVYVTVNTLIYEREVEDFLSYITFLHENGVDAIIMQDLGAMDLVRKTYPTLDIHASTQMNIHSKESVLLLEQLGIKRVVLAREMGLEEIQAIKRESYVELEVFVQGALCVSYSGQCLMSSLIGGRSGNRGACAGPCRMKYSLIKNNHKIIHDQYLLSMKDLCTLYDIGSLIDIGVESFKIEGRMKRWEYVYLAVSLYRKAIDSYCSKGKVEVGEYDILELKKLFHRGFTKGFLFHENNSNIVNSYRPNHMGIEIGRIIKKEKGFFFLELTSELSVQDGIRLVDDNIGFIVQEMYCKGVKVKKARRGDIVKIKGPVTLLGKVVKTTDFQQLVDLKEKLKIKRRLPLSMHIKAKINQPVKLVLSYGEKRVSVVSNYLVSKAKNAPTGKENIKSKCNKLKDTVYYLKELSFDVDEDIFIPVGVLNSLRREAVERLNERRLSRKEMVRGVYQIEVPTYDRVRNHSIFVDTSKRVEGYDEVYNIKDMKGTTLKLDRIMPKHPFLNKRVLASDLGSLLVYSDVVTDFSFNVVNSYTVALLHSLGAKKVTLSYELTTEEIEELVDAYHKRYKKHPNLEVIVDAYQEAMVCKYQLDGDYLEDYLQNRFPIRIRNGYMYLYHYKKRKLTDDFYKIGINWIRIHRELE